MGEREIGDLMHQLGEMRDKVVQAERDHDLLREKVVQAEREHLGDHTFLTSNWKRYYGRAKAIEDEDKFWSKTEAMLTDFYYEENQGDVSAMHAKNFAMALRQDVNS